VKREETPEEETMLRPGLEMTIGGLGHRGIRRGLAASLVAALVAVEGIQTLRTGTVVQPMPVETDRVLQPNPAGGGD